MRGYTYCEWPRHIFGGLQIGEYNRFNQQAALKAGVNYVDVTAISCLAADESDLLAPDQLHPFGKMYALWIAQLLPVVDPVLQEEV